jgi:hypothetical protein
VKKNDPYYQPGIFLKARYGHLHKGQVAIGMGYDGAYYIRVLAPGGIVGTVLDSEVTQV